MTLREAVEQGIMQEGWPSSLFEGAKWQNMDLIGKCLHCDREYRLGELVWTPDHDGIWVCPNAPTCDGTLLDFIDSWGPPEEGKQVI